MRTSCRRARTAWEAVRPDPCFGRCQGMRMATAEVNVGGALLNRTHGVSLRDRLTATFGAVISRCFFALFGTPE